MQNIYKVHNYFKLIYFNIILFFLYKYYIIKIGKVKDIKQYIKNRFLINIIYNYQNKKNRYLGFAFGHPQDY